MRRGNLLQDACCKRCSGKKQPEEEHFDRNSEKETESGESVSKLEADTLPSTTRVPSQSELSSLESKLSSLQAKILSLEQQLATKDSIIALLLADVNSAKAELSTAKSQPIQDDPNLKNQQVPRPFLAPKVLSDAKDPLAATDGSTLHMASKNHEQSNVINIPTHNRFSVLAIEVESNNEISSQVKTKAQQGNSATQSLNPM